ncbi:MAG: RNA methyltransferase [Kiritimatiellae bacterium]|nr:RNA methyltransferase [Kiritimatiellia bacterium]MBQ6329522.1 RNA methyltransferase [Kiritimatiellia bacterium]
MNPLDNIRVVLVGTLYTGNVGSACRAMANMGVHRLRLAAPNLQNGWDEGERLAVHATDVLSSREEFATFEESVADCVAVVGTTAREGLYRQHVRTPRDCASDILSLAATGPVALVFGREDKGLLNEEVAQCTHLVRIPVDEGYTSLNLAQAVLITCYELFAASGRYVPPHEKAPPAPQAQKMQLMKNWSRMLQEIGFMRPEQADHFMQGFHRVFSRGVFTKDDAALMLGVARQAIWAKEHGQAGVSG